MNRADVGGMAAAVLSIHEKAVESCPAETRP